MLSCVMKRRKTWRYRIRGSEKGCGWCGFVWVHSHNDPLCLECSASYGPILAHIPSESPPPSPPDLLQGYRNMCLFFKLNTVSSEKKPILWPCGQMYLSCSGKQVSSLPRVNVINLCFVAENHMMHADLSQAPVTNTDTAVVVDRVL